MNLATLFVAVKGAMVKKKWAKKRHPPPKKNKIIRGNARVFTLNPGCKAAILRS